MQPRELLIQRIFRYVAIFMTGIFGLFFIGSDFHENGIKTMSLLGVTFPADFAGFVALMFCIFLSIKSVLTGFIEVTLGTIVLIFLIENRELQLLHIEYDYSIQYMAIAAVMLAAAILIVSGCYRFLRAIKVIKH